MKKLNTPKLLSKGFTLVELLVVVAILTVLSGAAYIGIQRSQARMMNEKVVSDLSAISNALEQFRQDYGHYPNLTDNPAIVLGEDKNVNCFNSDTTYAHDCDASAFVQTMVDNKLLTKRYLQEVPTDPRTKSRYVYGVTTDGNYFQVAGVYMDSDGNLSAKVEGNVEKGFSLPSLIRAYDGPNFVMDGDIYLPYSPDHLSITATLDQIVAPVTVNGETADNGTVVKPGEMISTGVGASAVLYYSDGSVTHLQENTELRLLPNSVVDENDEDGIITKIRLKLFSGEIWNKVARLAEESEFNVETTSAIAGVRGTEWGIDDENRIIIRSGEVATRLKTEDETQISADDIDTYLEDLNKLESFRDDQIAINETEEIVEYTVPAPSNAIYTPSILAVDSVNEINADFYVPIFTNNLRPRVSNIDVQADQIVFELPENGIAPTVILMLIEGNKAMEWNTFDLNTAERKMTIREAGLGDFVGHKVQFQYRFIDGKREALSEPTLIGILIEADTVVSDVELDSKTIVSVDEEEDSSDSGDVTQPGGIMPVPSLVLVDTPKDYYDQGEVIRIKAENTIDSTVMPGVPVEIEGVSNSSVLTNADGIASLTLPNQDSTYNIITTDGSSILSSIIVAVQTAVQSEPIFVELNKKNYYSRGGEVKLSLSLDGEQIPGAKININDKEAPASFDTNGRTSIYLPTNVMGAHIIRAEVPGMIVSPITVTSCQYTGDGNECWIQGEKGESCSVACDIKVSLGCTSGDWNADANVCAGFGGTLNSTPVSKGYAPYLTSTCSVRDENTNQDCTASFQFASRLCKCN